jgi:hypothetical protein
LWAIAVLASLAALIILILCVPLDVVLHMHMDGRPKFRTRLAWLFGLVTKDLRREEEKPKEEKRAVEGKQKSRDRKANARLIFEVLRTKGLLGELGRLLRSILSRIKIREFGVNLRVGLDNPADTGLLFAFVAPVNLLLRSSSSHEIRIQPSFGDEAVLEGYCYGEARLQPIQLTASLIAFAFSLPAMRAVKTLVLTKWKGKR